MSLWTPTSKWTRSARERQAEREVLIDGLDLSVRAYSGMTHSGRRTLGEIADLTELDLFKLRNFGRRSLNEVRTVLADHGLQFSKGHKWEQVLD